MKTYEAKYQEALKEAEENVKRFPQFEKDGRIWVTVEGNDYPLTWFVSRCAMMKARGTI